MGSTKKNNLRRDRKNLLFYLLLIIVVGALILSYIAGIIPLLPLLLIAGILLIGLTFLRRIWKIGRRLQKES